MSTAALQCLSTSLCATLPEPIHPCALLPPSDPDVGVFPDIFSSIQQFKLTKPTWSDYTERCLGVSSTVSTAVTTEAITTTQGETTSVYHTVTLTEAVTNVTTDLNLGAITTDGEATIDWVIPVAVVVSLIIVFAIVFIIYKTCHHTKSSGATTHPVDLQLHENVNYLNNKAEVGAYWRGDNPDNIEGNGTTTDRTSASLIVSTETRAANGCNGDQLFLDSHKKTKLLSAEYNQLSSAEERRISMDNLETPAMARELVSDSPNLQSHRKPLPSPKPMKSDGKKRSRKSKSKKGDTSTIYANHQFEKLAKGHDNVVFEGEHDHKPLPPEPLLLPPLSRPPPPQPCEGNKPTPARRNKSKVSPSVNHI